MTDEELAALCLAPREQLDALVAAGDLDSAKERFATLEAAFLGAADFYRKWIAATQAFVYDSYGLDGLTTVARVEELARRAATLGVVSADLDDLPASEIVSGREAASNAYAGATRHAPVSQSRLAYGTLLDAGDILGARELWLTREQALSKVHDLYVAWQSDLLARVYKQYGLDVFERCLWYAGEEVFVTRMGADIATPPVERVRARAFRLHGHTAKFSITEDDDKFTITMDPCGVCGRQVKEGWLEPPVNLPVVRERHPASFLRPGEITVYQAHIAVIHHLLAISKIGVPWPPVRCAGTSGGPCELFLYKDPTYAPDEFYAQVGATSRAG